MIKLFCLATMLGFNVSFLQYSSLYIYIWHRMIKIEQNWKNSIECFSIFLNSLNQSSSSDLYHQQNISTHRTSAYWTEVFDLYLHDLMIFMYSAVTWLLGRFWPQQFNSWIILVDKLSLRQRNPTTPLCLKHFHTTTMSLAVMSYMMCFFPLMDKSCLFFTLETYQTY